MALNQPPPKPTNLSSKPLKSFNWTKIPPMKVKETVFASLDDSEVHAALKDTYKEFEELFAAKEVKKEFGKSGSSDSLPGASAKEITFLDPKRSQNTNIMLKAIKLSHSDIKRAINTFDLDVLRHHILGELLKCVPTEEELLLLKNYETDSENLASAEKFLFAMSEISQYEGKLKAMHFKASYEEYMDDAETMVSWLRRATEDVVGSKKFKELLKVILALGNYLNSGQRGGAYGFRLNSILKMIDTKSTVQNRKHTLLHYLTEIVPKKFPEVNGFQEELAHVEDGAKVTIPAIRQVLMTLRNGLKELESLMSTLQREIETPASSPTKNTSPTRAAKDKMFMEVLSSFHASASKAYEELDERFKGAEKAFEACVNSFGEDPKTTTPEEFFGVFWKFVQGFNGARLDNETAVAKAVEAEKKEEQKRTMEERRKKKREASTTHGHGHHGKDPSAKGHGADVDQGGLDDLISAIRTGKAFSGGGGGAGGDKDAPAPPRKRAGPNRDGSPTHDKGRDSPAAAKKKEKSGEKPEKSGDRSGGDGAGEKARVKSRQRGDSGSKVAAK
ncbi:hypothetical protein HK101_001353 [Irineochytrium annulatum]|nr:hypothetical protein HK101_001353 [Irineochytrium annulatum]